VGRKLMDAAERWSSSAGAAYLALATRRGASFYRALGYQDSATYFRKMLQAEPQ
jgi:histone acetyltransferase (RNA polymerase elongator complex component)